MAYGGSSIIKCDIHEFAPQILHEYNSLLEKHKGLLQCLKNLPSRTTTIAYKNSGIKEPAGIFALSKEETYVSIDKELASAAWIRRDPADVVFTSIPLLHADEPPVVIKPSTSTKSSIDEKLAAIRAKRALLQAQGQGGTTAASGVAGITFETQKPNNQGKFKTTAACPGDMYLYLYFCRDDKI